MAADVQDFSSAVTILGGSVSITGIATVSISGTPAVTISGTAAVSIAGTPNVNIASGSVAITGTPNINIQSQSVTVAVNQPQQQLASGTLGVNATFTGTLTLPAGTHAVMLIVGDTSTGIGLVGHQSGLSYVSVAQTVGGAKAFGAAIFAGVDTSVDVTITAGGSGANYWVVAVLDTLAPLALGQLAEYGQNVAQTSFGGIQVVGSSLQVLPTATTSDVPIGKQINVVLAGNATLLLVTNVSPKQVFLLALNLLVIAAGATTISLEEVAGQTFAYVSTNVTGFQPHDLKAIASAGNAAVQFRNITGVAAGQVIGELIYVQK